MTSLCRKEVPDPARLPSLSGADVVVLSHRSKEHCAMKSLVCGVSVLALLALAVLSTGPAGAADETPSIKDVMGKLHKGANSPLGLLKAELKSASPDWDKIQKSTKDFVILGASLAKNDPPKGDVASYKALATNYFNNSKALDDAAQAKDAAAAKAAFNKLSASCKECHTAHKGK
jgi:cytochrome c556